jgi:hypothetical protein
MTPQTKASLTAAALLTSLVVVPAVLIAFRDWVLAVTVFVIYSAVVWLFLSEMYQLLKQYFLSPMIEDQQATAGFEGDPLKLHFYRGFRKYFDGEVNEEQLQHWLERHRPQI